MKNSTLKKVPFAIAVLAVLILFATLMWGVTTSWGQVTITRTNIQSTDGKTLSAVVYRPKTATNETPAPIVVNLHGRANSAHVCDSWALEEARRGYVAVSMDINGGGESEPDPQNKQVFNFLNYLWDLPFVQADQTTVIGFSAGNSPCYAMISSDERYLDFSEAIVGYDEETDTPIRTKDNIALFIDMCAPKQFSFTEVDSTNVVLVKARQDEYNYGAFNYDMNTPYSIEAYNAYVEEAWADALEAAGDANIVPGKWYGDWAERTGRAYFIAENTIHQTPDVSKNAIEPMLASIMKAVDAPNPIDADNQVWGWAQIFAFACAVCAMLLVAALGKLLISLNLFEGIKREMPEWRGTTGKEFWIDILLATLLPAVLFIPLTAIFMKHIDGPVVQTLFKSTNLSAIIFWLVCCNIITLIIMVCKYQYKKKNGYQFEASHYALSGKGEKFSWKYVGLAFVVALLVFIIFMEWLQFSEEFFGIAYHSWIIANVESVCLARLFKSIPYMVLIFFVLFISGIGMNTGRRLKDTGNEKVDIIRNIAMNAAIAAFPAAILLILQYGSCALSPDGATIFPYGFTTGQTSMGALNYAWGFPFLMGSMASLNTYFYRKTGTVWVGALIGAMVAGALAFNGQPWV